VPIEHYYVALKASISLDALIFFFNYFNLFASFNVLLTTLLNRPFFTKSQNQPTIPATVKISNRMQVPAQK